MTIGERLEELRNASDRKLRLSACACVRFTALGNGSTVWSLLTDKKSKTVVRVAERFADGKATREGLSAARDAAWNAVTITARHAAWYAARNAAMNTAEDTAWDIARAAARNAARSVVRYAAWNAAEDAAWPAAWEAAKNAAEESQNHLLDDILCMHTSTLTVSPLVISLAKTAYQERNEDCSLDNDRLAVLADQLEEEGYDELVLSHLRTPQLHVRGCWALDLVLGLT